MNQAEGERLLNKSPVKTREAALRALFRLSWQPVPAGPSGFVAVWTSPVFRFRDDVKIEIEPENGSSRVKVHSVSRVGRCDFGQNARHVRDFFQALNEELERS